MVRRTGGDARTPDGDATNRAPTLGAVWWLSLGVLALNDHLLKGSGLLPGWLTGKLSDVAGLVVAPMLFAVVLRVRSRGRQLAVIAGTGAAFALVKLCRPVADGVEVALGALGFPSRVWTDPTDLLALLVLPLVVVLLGRPRVAPSPGRSRSSPLEVLGVALGGLACAATSVASYFGAGLLINASHEPVSLVAHRPSAALDCAGLEADAASVLATTQISSGECRTLYPYAGGMTLESYLEQDCGFVVIHAPGLPPTAIVWTQQPGRPLSPESEAEKHLHSYLHRVGDALYLEAAPNVDTLPYTTMPLSDECSVPN